MARKKKMTCGHDWDSNTEEGTRPCFSCSCPNSPHAEKPPKKRGYSDKERLDWLSEHGDFGSCLMRIRRTGSYMIFAQAGGDVPVAHAATLRAAIDAAIRESRKGGRK